MSVALLIFFLISLTFKSLRFILFHFYGLQSVVPRLAEPPGMLLEMQIKLHPKSTESETLGAKHSNTSQ